MPRGARGWLGTLWPALTSAHLSQRLRAQAEGHQPFFSTLETDLGKAKDVNERMVRGHSERDVDLERYRERVQQLLERWQAVLGQADLRQRELDQLGRQLRYYRQSCDALRQWIRDARQRQEAIQAVPITDSQTVREQLLQEKVVLAVGQGVLPAIPSRVRGVPGHPQWGKGCSWAFPSRTRGALSYPWLWQGKGFTWPSPAECRLPLPISVCGRVRGVPSRLQSWQVECCSGVAAAGWGTIPGRGMWWVLSAILSGIRGVPDHFWLQQGEGCSRPFPAMAGQVVLLAIPSHGGVRCALGWPWGAWAHPHMFPQKLLEECEQHKEKVEECQRYAKQYIDAIKVCPLSGGLGRQHNVWQGGGVTAPWPGGSQGIAEL